MKTYRIATIPGDGIGKEVVPAGREVLEALAKAQRGFAFAFTDFGWGGDWYRAHGEMMPADGLARLSLSQAPVPLVSEAEIGLAESSGSASISLAHAGAEVSATV